jgi:hypothetical protein
MLGDKLKFDQTDLFDLPAARSVADALAPFLACSDKATSTLQFVGATVEVFNFLRDNTAKDSDGQFSFCLESSSRSAFEKFEGLLIQATGFFNDFQDETSLKCPSE